MSLGPPLLAREAASRLHLAAHTAFPPTPRRARPAVSSSRPRRLPRYGVVGLLQAKTRLFDEALRDTGDQGEGVASVGARGGGLLRVERALCSVAQADMQQRAPFKRQ